MKIRFKKLSNLAQTPQRAYTTDAGFDLYSIGSYVDNHSNIVHKTGISIEVPDGYVGLIFPRSSIKNKRLSLSNCVGVIDPGYQGEILFVFRKLSFRTKEDSNYMPGDRIGQIIFIKLPEVELEEAEEWEITSERNISGFGSTGN